MVRTAVLKIIQSENKRKQVRVHTELSAHICAYITHIYLHYANVIKQNENLKIAHQGSGVSMLPTNMTTDHKVSTPEKYVSPAEVKFSQVDHCPSCKETQVRLEKFFKRSKRKLLAQLDGPRGKALMKHLRASEGIDLIKSAGGADDGSEVTAMRFILAHLRTRAAHIYSQKHGYAITSENKLLCRKCSGSQSPSLSPKSMKKRTERKKSLSITSLSDVFDMSKLSMQVECHFVGFHVFAR